MEERYLIQEHPNHFSSPLQFLIDPFHHVGGLDPLPMLFRECGVTHEPQKESLDIQVFSPL